MRGTTLFFSCSYAPVTIAGLLLSATDLQRTFNVAGIVFLIFAVGTFLSSWLLKRALAIGPGVGLAAFYQQLLLNSHPAKDVDPSQAGHDVLVAFFCASIVVGVLSIVGIGHGPSLRTRLVFAIPPQIKSGIKAGVGALLAASALPLLKITAYKHQACVPYEIRNRPVVFLFFISAFILLYFVLTAQRRDALEKPATGGQWRRIPDSLRNVAPLLLATIAVFVMLPTIDIACYKTNSPFLDLLQPTKSLLNYLPALGIYSSDYTHIINILVIVIISAFIMILDIPGSHYHFLGERTPKRMRALEAGVLGSRPTTSGLVNDDVDSGEPQQPATVARRSSKIIQYLNVGFMLDWPLSLVSSVLCLSPSVFYAENASLSGSDNRDAAAGLFCACLFLVFGVLFLFLGLSGHLAISVRLAFALRCAVAALLFTVGVRLVSQTFVPDDDELIDLRRKRAQTAFSRIATAYYLPVAVLLATVPLPGVGFEVGLPLSLIVYLMARIPLAKEFPGKINPLTAVLIGFSFAVVVFEGLVYLLGQVDARRYIRNI